MQTLGMDVGVGVDLIVGRGPLGKATRPMGQIDPKKYEMVVDGKTLLECAAGVAYVLD